MNISSEIIAYGAELIRRGDVKLAIHYFQTPSIAFTA